MTSALIPTTASANGTPQRRPRAQLAPEPGGQRGERLDREHRDQHRRVLAHERDRAQRQAPQPAHARPGGVQRAARERGGGRRSRSRRVERERDSAAGLDREREVEAEPVLGQRAAAAAHADVVGARDQPGRRVLLGSASRRRARRLGRACAPSARPGRSARSGCRPRSAWRTRRRPPALPRAGGRRCPGARRTSARPGCAAPRPTEDSRFERATLGTPASPSRVTTSSHERSSEPRQTSLIGSFLPAWPERNGSGKEPTTAGTRIARLPAVVVPPDAVARVELALAGALGRLDAVDVVEPVDPAAVLAAAGDAVDLLHEVAAEARLDVERALQQPHHRLALARLLAAGRGHPGLAEVLRDGHGDRPAGLDVGGPEAAAREQRGGEEDGERASSDGEHHPRRPARQRRAVAGAVDRDRVEHVAALASRAGSRYDQSARSPIAKYAPRPHRVPRKRSMRPEKYQHLSPSRLVRRSLTVLIPDASAKRPRSSRGPVGATCLSRRPISVATGAARSAPRRPAPARRSCAGAVVRRRRRAPVGDADAHAVRSGRRRPSSP